MLGSGDVGSSNKQGNFLIEHHIKLSYELVKVDRESGFGHRLSRQISGYPVPIPSVFKDRSGKNRS